MTVRDLKEELENYDEEMEVLYSVSGELFYELEAIVKCELESGQICVALL